MRKGVTGYPAVAQVSNLTCRGFPIRRFPAGETWFLVRGHSRLEAGDTAVGNLRYASSSPQSGSIRPDPTRTG